MTEKPCRVALVGMIGSGKSTVGLLLAARLGWTLVGSDVETAPVPCVVDVAADAIEDADVRRALAAAALVIWLDASPRTLARRARGAEDWMRTTLSQRAPLYKSVADLIVNTQRRRPASIVDQIIEWLGDQPGCMRLIDEEPPTA